MRQQTRWIFFLIILLAATSLACALGGGGGEEATSAEAEPATEEPAAPPKASEIKEESAPVSAEAEALDLSSVDTSLSFDSYRYAIEMTFDGLGDDGAELDQSVKGEVAVTTNPPAASMTFDLAGIVGAEEMGNFAMASVGDQTYMIVPGLGCIDSSMLGDELANPFADMGNPDTLLQDVQGAQRVLPNETINGVETEHYTFDETSVEDPNGDVDNVDGHIYVAADGGYMVRMTMTGTGNFGAIDETAQGKGSYSIVWDLLEIDGDVTIEIPEECSSVGDSTYPQLPDATEVAGFGGFVSYTSATPLADAIEFYKAALPGEGWTFIEGDSTFTEETALMLFTRDEETLNVTMGAQGNGSIFILISAE